MIWLPYALASGIVLFIAGGLDDIRRIREEDRTERRREAVTRHPSGRALPVDRLSDTFIPRQRDEDTR